MAQDAMVLGDILVGAELIECGPDAPLRVQAEEVIPLVDGVPPAEAFEPLPLRHHIGCGGEAGLMLGMRAVPDPHRLYLCSCGRVIRRDEVE